MEDLKKLVAELVGEQDEGLQIGMLQRMNDALLTKFVLRMGDDCVVYPLHVEAYYYHPGRFEDRNVHGCKSERGFRMQSNRFGKLYFHTVGRGGVDVCLSDGDYCLSFLIKASKWLVDGVSVFAKQVDLFKALRDVRGTPREEEVVLEPVGREIRESDYVFHTVRKGLTEDSFRKAALASLTELEKPHRFSFEKGYGKKYIIGDFIASHLHTASEGEIEDFMLRISGYRSKTV
ncbi:MAG: hypothetical protein LBP25_04010 [Tannerellaceae bacterium]|jgi:hypothetical protein|nr:hypothetical protein [Tannerellaceae bacterium]